MDVEMDVVAFVVLTVAVFAVLGLVQKLVERL
ncbi:potassium-transporting ATPase [Mycobacterium sp. E1747]|nr:potassium-transporting ATPase [Mycobacterium sp. E1747]